MSPVKPGLGSTSSAADGRDEDVESVVVVQVPGGGVGPGVEAFVGDVAA